MEGVIKAPFMEDSLFPEWRDACVVINNHALHHFLPSLLSALLIAPSIVHWSSLVEQDIKELDPDEKTAFAAESPSAKMNVSPSYRHSHAKKFSANTTCPDQMYQIR